MKIKTTGGKHRPPVPLILLLALSLTPVVAQDTSRPLTRQRLLDTLDVLKGEAAEALVPQVRQRGVEFQLSADDEREMRAAGAPEKLLAAIRESFRPPPLAPVAPGAPLSREEIVLLITNGVPQTRMEELVNVRGVSFVGSGEDFRELSAAGAWPGLVNLIRARTILDDTQPPVPTSAVAVRAVLDPGPSTPVSLPPPQPEPAPLPQAAPQEENVWVVFYGVCEKPDTRGFPAPAFQIRFGGVRADIFANDRELAKLDCNKFFYAVVQPGSYKFCATKKKCRFAAVSSGSLYYFRVLSKNDFSIEQVTPEAGQAEMESIGAGPIDPKRVTLPDVITTDSDRTPPSALPALPPVKR